LQAAPRLVVAGNRKHWGLACGQHPSPSGGVVNAKVVVGIALLTLGAGVFAGCGSSSATAGITLAVPTSTANPFTVPAPAPVPQTPTRTATAPSGAASGCDPYPGTLGGGHSVASVSSDVWSIDAADQPTVAVWVALASITIAQREGATP
jgi:hypothetical protein